MTQQTIDFFNYEHLPPHLQATSREFCELAYWVMNHLPDGEQKERCLHKLLEAKDCAVRADLGKPRSRELGQ